MRHAIFFVVYITLIISGTMPANATVIYVHKDSPCPGHGSSSKPFCSIQQAFKKVSAGGRIRIRQASTPYDERAVATTSGTATQPIIVEADDGNVPILRYSGRNAQQGAIEVRDADYWLIQNLTFDGTDTQTSRYAILLLAESRDITGHQIVHNTFRNWGGSDKNTKGAAAIMLRPIWNKGGFTNHVVQKTVIRDNQFTDNANTNIHLTKAVDSLVEGNTIEGTRCGFKSNNYLGATGIKDTQEGKGNIFRNNLIRNYQAFAACAIEPRRTAWYDAAYVGIYCDTGPTHGEVSHNTIYNIGNGNAENRKHKVKSAGIFIESRCSDWKIQNNVVYHIGEFGLINGTKNTGNADRNQWLHNTVFGVKRAAFRIGKGRDLMIQHNILIHDQATAAIEVQESAVGDGQHAIDYNLYWDTLKGQKVGRWGNKSTWDLTAWRKVCGCDAHSRQGTPNFVSLRNGAEDFRLQTMSPAVGAGENGVDIGAFPVLRPQPGTQ